MNQLLLDIAQLRRQCPWYRAQTLETLRTYLSEEFHEVLSALEDRDPIALKEELGDLLFQIMLYSQLASESGWFTMTDVIENLHHKIIRRNQHIFGKLIITDIEAVNMNWQYAKAAEREHDRERGDEKMYEVTIEEDKALVTFKNRLIVGIPLTPPAAQLFAPGYTDVAWIWLALTDAFKHADILLPEGDAKRLAILISKQVNGFAQYKLG